MLNPGYTTSTRERSEHPKITIDKISAYIKKKTRWRLELYLFDDGTIDEVCCGEDSDEGKNPINPESEEEEDDESEEQSCSEDENKENN